jgi:hypothetical protein
MLDHQGDLLAAFLEVRLVDIDPQRASNSPQLALEGMRLVPC